MYVIMIVEDENGKETFLYNGIFGGRCQKDA